MKKIGRNEKCPCGSGKKYKHCCALRPEPLVAKMSQEHSLKVTLTEAVQTIQRSAAEKKKAFMELGVFLLFATAEGDAWLLEITDSDCVQLSRGGETLQLPFDENPETIELDWSHTFSINRKQFVIKAYADESITELPDAPSQEINAAIKRIRKKLSPELISQVHQATSEE